MPDFAGILARVVYIRGMAGQARTVLVSLVAVALFSGAASGQAFFLTGIGPGGQSSRVYGLSADGSVASGGSQGPNAARGFVWSPGTGRYDFVSETGLSWHSPALAISGIGTVVVGAASSSSAPPVAYRWSGPGTFESLGLTGGYDRSYAVGVSNDGSVIAGRLEFGVTGNFGQAFRWTEGGGFQMLGVTRPGQHGFSQSMGVSRDGSTVVGISRGADTQAFIWTTALGMQELPALPGTGNSSTQALAVNFDGRIVVGRSGPVGTATMWRDGVPLDLGGTPSHPRSSALAVSDSGHVVGGYLSSGGTNLIASVWTQARGIEPLTDYLLFHGVTVPAGVSLREVTSVSATGNVIAGYTSGSNSQGFVVVIPAPAPVGLFTVHILSIASRRRR